MGFSSKVPNIFDRVLDTLAFVAAILIIFIMLAISANVVLRKIGQPQLWLVESPQYAMLYITFLVTAWLLKRDKHVKVELLASRLNSRNQALLGLFACTIGIIVSLVLVVFGSQVTLDYFQQHIFRPTELHWQMYPLLAIIPIGSLLLLFQFLRRAYGYMSCIRR
ncbi:TRAP transporter small permease [Chloroflexota bacterium]